MKEGKHCWQDNIKMGVKEKREKGRDQIQLAQDTDKWCIMVNTIMNFRDP